MRWKKRTAKGNDAEETGNTKGAEELTLRGLRIFMRHHRKMTIWFLICALAAVPLAAEAQRGLSCRAAIFSDSTRVKRLYGKSVHLRLYPASTTKVMTALLVLEKLPLNKIVRVSQRATSPQPSKLYVKEGEQFKVRDLLYAILMGSANDASVVLAEAVSGTEWQFVQLMNKRAKEIGAKNTKFANSHGLPSKTKQYTTAYDMYLIFRQALKHPVFKEIIKIKYKTIYSQGGRKFSLKSHNRILFNDWGRKVYGKTGYTRQAGACFVGTLQKGKSTLIMALFNCPSRWYDIKHLVQSYAGLPI